MAEIEIGLGAVVGRACSNAASDAAMRPLPSEETTPPVMKMYRAMGGGC
jgi:hypothetical protein